MRQHNEDNERIKRRYVQWLKNAEGYSSSSIDQALAAILRFEASNKYRSFKVFKIEQAMAFRRRFEEEKSQATGEPLSASTVQGTLKALRKFFKWLADQPGYKSRISHADAEYFKAKERGTRSDRPERFKNVPTLEQVRTVIDRMPDNTAIDRRNRALIAFLTLTGARDSAVATFRLKHIDMDERTLDQDGREVRTKNRKRFISWFFPVGTEIEEVVENWVRYLEEELLFGPNDPLFPKTMLGQDGNKNFAAIGLTRECWSSAQPIRKILANAFAASGLPVPNPHCFRDMLTRFGMQRIQTAEQMKAWSQNLGHENMGTTWSSYGKVTSDRQARIMRQMTDVMPTESKRLSGAPSREMIREVLDYLDKKAF